MMQMAVFGYSKSMKLNLMTEQEYRKRYGVRKAAKPSGNPNVRFRDPAHFQQLKNPGWTVVHGFIVDPETGLRIGHAWAEKDGLVIDLFYGFSMMAPQYRKIMKANEVYRFTKKQMRVALDEFQTYGPYGVMK